MKELLIIGKAPIQYQVYDLKTKKNEVWMLGTDEREGADVYYELHGIKVNHPNTVYSLPDEVYRFGLPINSSIGALLVYAYIKGYKRITLIGAPMDATHEYAMQKPAVACIIGWLMAKGVKVDWGYMPQNTDYGRVKDID